MPFGLLLEPLLGFNHLVDEGVKESSLLIGDVFVTGFYLGNRFLDMTLCVYLVDRRAAVDYANYVAINFAAKGNARRGYRLFRLARIRRAHSNQNVLNVDAESCGLRQKFCAYSSLPHLVQTYSLAAYAKLFRKVSLAVTNPRSLFDQTNSDISTLDRQKNLATFVGI